MTVVLGGCGDGDPSAASGSGGAETTVSHASSSSRTSSSASSAVTTSGAGAAGGGCVTTDPGNGGSAIADEGDPCATLNAPGEPEERVVFMEKGQDSAITTPVELMWAWQYAARAPKQSFGAYAIEEERCSKPSGRPETCDVVPLAPMTDACVGPLFGPKFAIDPSQYRPGENVYRITVRMKRGCDTVSSDAFTMHITYTPPP